MVGVGGWELTGDFGMDRTDSGRVRCGCLGIGLASVLLAACAPSVAPRPALARQCSSIGGAREAVLRIGAPGRGTLRIGIEERGISVVGLLDDDAGTISASPVERLGTIVLTADATPSEPHIVRIRAEDSPDITGEVCVSADLVSPSDRVRVQAEQDLAAAGRAVQAKDWDHAFEAYLRAARSFDHLGVRQSAGQARHAMAELAYLRFDRKRDSYALAGEALADYSGNADPMFVGLLAGLQAKALLDLRGRDLHVVAPAVRERLSVAGRYDAASPVGKRELPRLDIMTGFLEFLLDAPERAHGLFAQAAQRCREEQDWDCYAIASQNLAQLAEENNNYALALSTYADALHFLPPELDPKLVADIWTNLGRLQGAVGLFSGSERSNAAAMKAYARLGDCPGVRLSLARSGRLLVQVGTLADAESYLQQAASLDCPSLLAAADTRSAPHTSDRVVADVVKARSYWTETREGREGRLCARPLDADTLTIENKIVVFNSLLSLGDALMLEGESAQARRCLDAAQPYAADSRSQIRLANARGTALLEGNDSAGARAAFEQALRIADEARFPPAYEHRGSAQLGLVRSMLLAGKAADTLQDSFQALESSVARGDIDRTVTSLRLIAAGERGSGQAAAAARTLEAAAHLIEAVPIDELDGEKRATFLATQHTVFAELTDLFASDADDSEKSWLAFEASERGRARSLRYALNQATRDASSPVDAPPVARYQQLLHDVVHITAQTDTSQARSTLIDQIDSAARRESGVTEPLDRVQLMRTLKQLNATLVEYAVGSTDMFAFVIYGGGARVVRLGDSRDIANAAANLRDRLHDTETPASDVRAAAQRLARLVLWPIREFLTGRRIVFVPDDALHTVPLAVLPWAADAGEQLVLHHAETTLVPSALFLTRVHPTGTAHNEAPRIELIGDPVFRISDWRRECIDIDSVRSKSPPRVSRAISDWTQSLPRLPGTRAEVSMIARLTHDSRPASRVETHLGCAAVPAALRRAASTDVDLLHIATHARIDAQRPRLSALALTPEPGTDGAASAFGLLDILGLKLNSRLVVLSACETSRGRLLQGEGVLGPAQAFLQAGATAVLASYWRVDDQITSNFMQQFYKHLLVDRLSASAALRRAQLDRAGAGASYEWAAFALYGWPESAL
jgi:CHAT domain-containing protein